MLRLDGLPLHPLIVHLPVVLVPLVAAGAGLFLAVPRWRRVLGPLLVGLALAGAAGAVAATWSGAALGDALRRGSELDAHRSFGERTRTYAVVLAVAIAALVAYERRGDRPPTRVLGTGAAVLVVALGATAAVTFTGHSGAKLAWAAKVPVSPVPGASGDGIGGPAHPEAEGVVPSSVLGASGDGIGGPARPEAPGVDVVLGEWALVASVRDVPPGLTTFRFVNRGTVAHAFRIRSAGSGKHRLEWRSPVVAPGQSAELVADLPAGAFDLDCPIEDGHGEHDALGMEAPLTVRAGAPAPTSTAPAPPSAPPAPAAGGAAAGAVEIAGFAFSPAELRVPAGAEVTFTNRDPAPHTAAGEGFDTGTLAAGASARRRFDRPGTFTYLCTIHPAMTGRVVVT